MALFSSGKSSENEDGLVIGLVNNMPDAALEATEQQFASLLEVAAGAQKVRLRLFSLPGVPRGKTARERILTRYSDIGKLGRAPVDGLIVTGAEPCAADLKDEPYWRSLIEVLRWAEANAVPTIWSCLAAHAVVLHLSGIRRRRLKEKCSGVFRFERVGDQPFSDGLPAQFLMPHSRYNGLLEDELAAAGFAILSRSAIAGVDMFLKDGEAPFLFVQGHPEYQADTLLREYRRDIRRYLKGEAATYPAMPVGYFDEATAQNFERLRKEAMLYRCEETMTSFLSGVAEPALANLWRPTAIRLYANWLSLLMLKKATVLAREFVFDLGQAYGESGPALRP